MTESKKSGYIHGTNEEEQQRLSKLNNLTNASFIEFVKIKETDHILELGSGLGILAAQISKKLSAGKLTGIEISSYQIAKCPPETENLAFLQGDARELPFENNAFDVVYCRYILEHVPDATSVLQEARRVLRPGGSLYIQENAILLLEFYPDCPRFKSVWKAFAQYQSGIGGDAMIGLKLYDLLKRTGFTNLQLSMAPELHYHEAGTLVPWIDNLIGNIRGVRDDLINGRYITLFQYEEAEKELEAFKRNEYASSYFYWNRAKGIRE
jgi:ubiquinone/menaquinone biosynthesis C-methylase UbiE